MDTHLMAAPHRDDRIQLTMSCPVPAYQTYCSPMSNGAWRLKGGHSNQKIEIQPLQ